MTESELIGVVLAASIVLSALPSTLLLAKSEVCKAVDAFRGLARPTPPSGDPSEAKGLLDFVALFVSVAQRICMAVAVQLISANVHFSMPIRAVRVLTLLGVAVFFVFVEKFAVFGK